MFKKILVAVDGSEHALRAVDMAAGLAETCAAELSFVHIVRDPRLPEGLKRFVEEEYPGESPEYVALHLAADKLLAEAAERSGRKGMAKLTAEGDPAGRILDTAKNGGADLIVLGSRGLTDVASLLLGSVSHKVLHLAPCACLMVK